MGGSGPYTNNVKIRKTEGSRDLLLQVTFPVRDADLVEEEEQRVSGGEGTETVATYLADVRVHAVRSHILIVDRDRVDAADEADLVTTAINDTETAYRTKHSTITRSGNGYQLQISVARDAGFYDTDTVVMESAPGIIVGVRSRADCSPPGGSSQLAEDLAAIRAAQAESPE